MQAFARAVNMPIRFLQNIALSAVYQVAPRLANVFVFVLVGRLIGPSEAGTLALALAYLTFSTMLVQGVDDLVIRQVAREPNSAGRYLCSFLILRLGFGVISYGAVVLIVSLIDYSPYTTSVILVLNLSLIPEGLMYVVQSVLLGQQQYLIPAAVVTGTSLFKFIAGILVEVMTRDLRLLSGCWFLGSVIGLLILLRVSLMKNRHLVRTAQFDLHLLAVNNYPIIVFLAFTLILAIQTQAGILILSGFRNETEVGWYNAATTILSAILLLLHAYRLVIYPLMTRYAISLPERLLAIYIQSLRYLGIIVWGITAGIVLLAPQIISLLFGHSFAPSIEILQILAGALPFIFLNEPSSRIMLVYDRYSQLLLALTGSTLISVFLDFLLVPSMGAKGIAIAYVISSGILFAWIHFYAAQCLSRANFLQELIRPLIAACVFLPVLAFKFVPPWVSLTISVFLYISALIALKVISIDELILFYQDLRRYVCPK
jgi:O-antigen/teichoic acid export membrane protein